MSAPRSFAAAAYPTKEDAEQALDRLEELRSEKIVKLADSAIAVKTADGEVELHQRHGLSIGGGAVAGGTIGLLAGLLLGVPIAAAAAGLAIGGGAGLLDRGIEDSRMKDLAAALEPGHAILCVLIEDADWARLRERIAPMRGELLVLELTAEAEAALAAAAPREGNPIDP